MASGETTSTSVMPIDALPSLPLETGVTEDYIDCTASVGLTFHILEAGNSNKEKKSLVLLLHGFPEIAYSWRKIMPALASAGNHVVAVDQRGYGRTTGRDTSGYEQTDLVSFSMTSYVADMVRLVGALGYDSVRCVIGHDMGAAVASRCALARPDIFTSCVLMSHPFKSTPSLRAEGRGAVTEADIARDPDIEQSLAELDPPMKPYKWYNSKPQAAHDWENSKQGLKDFLRGYFHLKSANWKYNKPHPLDSWTAREVAQLPGYYCMPFDKSVPDTINADMQGEDQGATEDWLSDKDLDVYVQEWQRTGFQGGLNFYRTATNPPVPETNLMTGAKLTVPCVFVSGEKDWGNYQDPGALKGMEKACTKYLGFKEVRDAGHWPQQEQPGIVVAYVLDFLWRGIDSFDKASVKSAPPHQTKSGTLNLGPVPLQVQTKQLTSRQPDRPNGVHAGDANGDIPYERKIRGTTSQPTISTNNGSNATSHRAATPVEGNPMTAGGTRAKPTRANTPVDPPRRLFNRADTPIDLPRRNSNRADTPIDPPNRTSNRADTPIDPPKRISTRADTPIVPSRRYSNRADTPPMDPPSRCGDPKAVHVAYLPTQYRSRDPDSYYLKVYEQRRPLPGYGSATPFEDYEGLELSVGGHDGRVFPRFR